MFNLMNGMNQQRYRFNVDKYISNSKQVFTVQKNRVQLRLQPQPQQALAPVLVAHTPIVAPAPVAVHVAPAPVAVPEPVHRLVSLKPRHTEEHAPVAHAPVAHAPVAHAPKRSSNLVKIK